MRFKSIFRFIKKHIGVLCVLFVLAIVLLALFSYQSWLFLGNFNYVYNEYDVEISFEHAKSLLEEKGYYFTELSPSSTGSIKEFWILHNDDDEKQSWTQLFVCDTTEQAKEIYQSALCGTDSDIPAVFTQTRTLYRVNNCVYFTKNAFQNTADILNTYGIDAPEPIPVVRCNCIEQNILSIDDLRQSIDALNYKRYLNLAYDESAYAFEYLIPPEKNACLVLLQASEPLSERQQEDIYKALLPITEKDYLGVKMVVISDDTVIMGDDFTIDLFLERVDSISQSEN